jgi:hypothetical protein
MGPIDLQGERSIIRSAYTNMHWAMARLFACGGAARTMLMEPLRTDYFHPTRSLSHRRMADG